jgi:outer membrane protein OmpA-like peptidoglycan-associated protein
MPLTEIDVLRTLSDPVLKQIDFHLDSMHIRGEAYQKIYELIDDEQILVVEGKDPNRATYDPGADTITTQNAPTPPDAFARSLLVHEATHAIKDMEHVTITALGNEAAAYIAQATYLLLSAATAQVPPGNDHIRTAIRLAKKFNLDTAPGAGIRIKYDDIIDLVRKLNKNKAYQQDQARLSTANGISKKPRKRIRISGSDEPAKNKGQFHPMSGYKVPTDALFDFNKHDIKSSAIPALEEAAAYIAEFMGPGHKVYITGHTDNVGGPVYNDGLSNRRAAAVAKWLVDNKKVDAARVVTGGDGEEKPIAPNNTPDGRARNRRVEILIM